MNPRPARACLIGLTLLAAACSDRTPSADGEQAQAAWVGAASCTACHAEAASAWTGSDHQQAMAIASPATVLGDFDDASFDEGPATTRFSRDGDRYFVETGGADGEPTRFEVKYTFGVRPLQQYLVELPDGRVQALTVAWDVDRRRWFSLRDGESLEPGEWRHWTGGASNWNAMCADCHSTDLRRNYDALSNSYATAFTDINVACEACHGPGSEHVAWAHADAQEQQRRPDRGLTVTLGPHGSAAAEVETCAVCHAVRQTVAPGWVPGRPLLDHYRPELLTETLYFPDGQPREEVFEYGSFLQSRMYAAGVRCSNCHEPHSGELRAPDNSLCGQCHQPAQYDTTAHHFHDRGSAGAACVECHMPTTTFMQIDERRDHSFRVPRPDLGSSLGTPDACTRCHSDRDPTWAAQQIAGRYGTDRSPRDHFAHVLAAGRAGANGADTALVRLSATPQTPDILRATAVSLLGGYSTVGARTAALRALNDSSPLVRAAAVGAFETAPETGLVAALAARLADPARAVRVEAARVLARAAADPALRAPPLADAFDAAIREYRVSLSAVDDQPEGQLNLGVLNERLGDLQAAEQAYRAALRLEPAHAPAHVNLATVLDRRRAGSTPAEAARLRAEAESHLRQALRLEQSPQASYALGLLLGEDAARMDEAAVHLATAAAALPLHPRVQYNAGLAHQTLGRAAEAEPLLLAAHRLEPQNPAFLNALSVFYVQQKRWADALAFTDALLAQFPAAPELLGRRASITAELR